MVRLDPARADRRLPYRMGRVARFAIPRSVVQIASPLRGAARLCQFRLGDKSIVSKAEKRRSRHDCAAQESCRSNGRIGRRNRLDGPV